MRTPNIFGRFRRAASGTLALVAVFASAARGAQAPREDAARQRLAAVSLPFVRNEGQADPAVAYSAATFAGTVFLTKEGEIVYSLQSARDVPSGTRVASARSARRQQGAGWTLSERLLGGRPILEAGDPSAARASFYLGSDPAKWRLGVETASSVLLGEVWPGIRLALRARGGTVEKVFTLASGADPSLIRGRIDGAQSLRVDQCGDLVVETGLGPVQFSAPVAYQERGGIREPIAAGYRVRGRDYGFEVGPYDPALALVIDPILQSTFAGGAGSFDQIDEIAFHPTTGDVYASGFGNSAAFPGTTGGSQATYGGGNQDAVVVRFNADLTTLEQATYLGGSAYDIATSIAISAAGDVYVSGETTSTNFPATAGGAQTGQAGLGDAFVVKLPANLTGTIQSTYLGGASADHGSRSLAVDPGTGKVFVGGWGESKTFPGTAGGAQSAFTSSFAGWVARLNAGLTALEQTTFIGEGTQLFAMTLTSAGIYAAGHGGIPPALTGAQTELSGSLDAFITLLPKTLTSFVRSTLYGAEGLDSCFSVAVNGTSGDVYITGATSSLSLPGAFGGAQRVRQGTGDNYVARFNGTLTQLLGATYNGGTGGEGANALDINQANGDVYITGTTSSARLPGSTAGAQRIYGGGSLDAFVVRFNADLTSVLGGTFLGGGPDSGQANSGDDEAVAVRYNAGQNEVYVAGYTSSSDFPKVAGGGQAVRGGVLNDQGTDGFVARLTPDLQSLFAPQEIVVDPTPGASSDGNLVLEPGETVAAQPSWKNLTGSPASISGAASAFSGPAGATYTLTDAAASYGSVAAGATKSCTAVPNCFSLTVSAPATRPAPHWDATFIETPTPDDAPMKWTVHVGDSFTDVPRSYPFYRKIETLFHNGITLGCTATTYCLSDPVPRVNMAIFIARAIAGGAGFLPDRGVVNGSPYACLFFAGTSLFSDVATTDPACPAVHYLAALNVATGCEAGVFCTTLNVTRGEMAIFMARGVVAPGGGAAVPLTYTDPVTARSYSCSAGAPNLHFTDVTTTDLFCKHVHFLWAKGIIDGCGGTLYCPAALMHRDEMAKFLSNSFALPLYTP